METLYPSSSDLHVPSGAEVESASLHPPVLHEQTHELSWKEKLTMLPKQQLDRVRPRVMEMKMKTTAVMNGAVDKVNTQLRAKPGLFAGIAAGAGLALGIAGRIARHRAAKKDLPTLLIIQGAC